MTAIVELSATVRSFNYNSSARSSEEPTRQEMCQQTKRFIHAFSVDLLDSQKFKSDKQLWNF